jgi:hypothetical protein
VEITEVRRQREDWQRQATRDLATGKVDGAIEAYAQRIMSMRRKPARRRGSI